MEGGKGFKIVASNRAKVVKGMASNPISTRVADEPAGLERLKITFVAFTYVCDLMIMTLNPRKRGRLSSIIAMYPIIQQSTGHVHCDSSY
jgi:hypothetical protein